MEDHPVWRSFLPWPQQGWSIGFPAIMWIQLQPAGGTRPVKHPSILPHSHRSSFRIFPMFTPSKQGVKHLLLKSQVHSTFSHSWMSRFYLLLSYVVLDLGCTVYTAGYAIWTLWLLHVNTPVYSSVFNLQAENLTNFILIHRLRHIRIIVTCLTRARA